MKIYLAEVEIWNYTLTTWGLTKAEAVATLKKEWLRQKNQHRWNQTWADKKDSVSVWQLEQNQIEWR
jgi:hypothetical protein